MSVIRPVLSFAKTRPDAPALIDGDRTVSYATLASLVARMVTHLTALGLRRGDRVGLCLKDSADHVIALLGVAQLGAVGVSLDWRAKPLENAQFINGLKLSHVLIEPDGRLMDHSRASVLDRDWQNGLREAKPDDAALVDWHDPFMISATSGSTGTPKFTLMTHLQYHFAISGMFELMALTGRHRFLATMPLYYSGGRNSCMTHLLRGDCVVLYPSLFRPAEYVDIVRRHVISVAAIVPSVVRQLLPIAGDEPLFPDLAALFCTGAPLHAEEKRAAAQTLTPNFQERYGTAETMAISVLRSADFADRADSVGQPHSLAEVEIVDEDDKPLPNGGVGLLRFRGPGLGSPMAEQAATANFRDGWYYPGEIGHLDHAGYIFLHGRTSDVIMRQGAKVYPAEIEAVLLDLAGVQEAAVIGQRGADNEESVIAFVKVEPRLSQGTVLAHCRSRLTAHKVPRQIHLVAELPKNTAGKIDKPGLFELLAGKP